MLYFAEEIKRRKAVEYTFNLTEQDYLDFNTFTVKDYAFYKKQKKLLHIIFTMLPFATGLLMWFFRGRRNPGVDFIVGFLIAVIPLTVLIWFYFPKFFDMLTLKNAKKVLFKEGKNNVLGERTVFFEADKIRTVSRFEESSIQYGAITQVKQSENAVYLYTAPAMAIVIPLRVFADDARKKEWLDFINTKLQKT